MSMREHKKKKREKKTEAKLSGRGPTKLVQHKFLLEFATRQILIKSVLLHPGSEAAPVELPVDRFNR